MAEQKKPYQVVQEGRDGAPIDILGQPYHRNDTVWLTDGEAKYLIGLSIEPGVGNTKAPSTPVGEHRESGAEVVEETRPMKEMEVQDEDVRAEKRPVRSTPAKRS